MNSGNVEGTAGSETLSFGMLIACLAQAYFRNRNFALKI
jgi:hypothetical protein